MYTNWAQEFPLRSGLVHLNHAGVGPWPRRTIEAVIAFANENAQDSTRHASRWGHVESELRRLCQQLINAENVGDIAFIKNTSEGLSIVAYGIPWQSKDNVVFAQQEFSSNRVIWQSLPPRFGIEARAVDLYQAATPEDALFNQVDSNTRLIAVSAVQYGTGLRMDLAKISEYCRARGILLCVDAIQALGAIPFDLSKTPADFVVADGHKWLLSPEGIGLFYCNPDIRKQLRLNQFGWHMLERKNHESLNWSPANDARRFECGSLNRLGVHAMHASLSLVLEISIKSVHDMIYKKISYIYEKAEEYNLEIISDMNQDRRSGIITVRRPDTNNQLLYKYLLKAGVLCAYRNAGIRFSPHFYTQVDGIDKAMDMINRFT